MEKITGRRNPVAMHLKKLGSSREYRKETAEFFCDGAKLLAEAVKSGAEITCVISDDPLPFSLLDDVRVYSAPRELIDSISPLKNSPGVIFSCKMPQSCIGGPDVGTKILLDGLQDPGNTGTIIRTAEAFGISKILLYGNCADLYNPKTVRASMGAVFRQKSEEVSITELDALVRRGDRLLGAALGDGSRDIAEISLKNAVIAIGNEGRGLSSEILSLCSELVKIPISGICQSLNAGIAASIIMWEARKQLGAAP